MSDTDQITCDFTSPLFLNPTFSPNNASIDDLETYLLELGLVLDAVEFYRNRMQPRTPSHWSRHNQLNTLAKTIRHHRAVYAIATHIDDFIDSDKVLVWEPRPLFQINFSKETQW